MRPALPPALAVMAKVPGMGPVKSRLHPALTAERATELYRCFLLDRLDAVASLEGVSPVVAFTPEEAEPAMKELTPAGFLLMAQRGADLGERLSALLAELLARGHAGAMAIDSDSPTLPMRYVSEAADVLASKRSDVVLGPCEDGGYYLIGVGCPPAGALRGDRLEHRHRVRDDARQGPRPPSVRARPAALVRRGHGERPAAPPH